jgi:transporter family-2 protein
MDRGAAVLLTAVVGGLIALQAPVNAVLGHRIGTAQAAFASFAIGTLALAALVAVAGDGFGRIADASGVGWIYLTGGLLGALYVTTAMVTVRTLGAGGVTAATIAGQLAASVLVDHYGWLGVARQPATLAKLIGIVLLAAGTWLVVRE